MLTVKQHLNFVSFSYISLGFHLILVLKSFQTKIAERNKTLFSFPPEPFLHFSPSSVHPTHREPRTNKRPFFLS